MPAELITVDLFRDFKDEPWGFTITGGKAYDEPLSISDIQVKSIAERLGLKIDDVLIKINGEEAEEFTYEEACQEIAKGEDSFDMVIERTTHAEIRLNPEQQASEAEDDRQPVEEPIFMAVNIPKTYSDSPPPDLEALSTAATSGVTPELGSVDRESSEQPPELEPIPPSAGTKPDQTVQPVAVASNHATQVQEKRLDDRPLNHSEPMIQEDTKYDNLASEDRRVVGFKDILKPTLRKDWNCPWVKRDGRGLKHLVRGQYAAEPVVAPVATSHWHFYSQPHSILDPGLSEEEVREMQRKFFEEQERLIQMEEDKRREEIEDAQRRRDEILQRIENEKRAVAAAIEQRKAEEEKMETERLIKAPEEEAAQSHPTKETEDNRQANKSQPEVSAKNELEVLDTQLVAQLVGAIQAGMEQYHQSKGYEPSPDELIDVLKNLENLAASNPSLYRAIVDQIKVHQPSNPEKPAERREPEEAQPAPVSHETVEHIPSTAETEPNGEESEAVQVVERSPHETKLEPIPPLKEDPLPHVDPFPEGLVSETTQTQPRPTQNGTVEKGSNHPMVNGNPEPQVGLYPKPMDDYDYPWAGSLKPVSNQLFAKDYKSKREANDPGPCPWAGSLRPVRDKRNRAQRRSRHDDEFDGKAPWAGSLKHVPNPPHSTFHRHQVTQFKRYPDEDAPNPYQGYRINELQMKEEEEQMERIRNNLRERKTVSNSLLKVLMPKLLAEHSSKYEPMSEDESLKIMQDILAMKIGLNSDQNIEDNEEAEQMIRAITHGEISKDVYSQMADDLETAHQRQRQDKKVTKVTPKSTSGILKGVKTETEDVDL
eukprot:maker-scaffold493_size155937-snap-gene-0.19 protein:Tk11846 transcript:maker-scaffold493_size155937-snap-gene-0.19-mRNA-1 annotation:"pdz and lim domain protein zasp"